MGKAISVVGLGKLGAPLAACLAARGMRVIGVDSDARKVAAVNHGQAPVYESQLEEFIHAAGTRLTATQDIYEAVSASEITFIVVATPSEPSGDFSLEYVLPVCQAIGNALRAKQEFHLVVLTSTVMPGTTGGVVRGALEKASGKIAGVDFGLCYGPEFIALGSVIHDFLHPDFVLIGESDPHSGAILETLYEAVCENAPRSARMNFINAEITKLSINTFVTTKISFANMLARICERLPGADVDLVTAALGLDTRIGSRYLKGSVSYGGPCFPRDNIALAAFARSIGAPPLIAEVTHRFNCLQIEMLADLVQVHTPAGGRIGILGLTYKPNTDVIEQSVGLLIAQKLAEREMSVLAYDPAGNGNAAEALGSSVEIAPSADKCIEQADIVILTTAWAAFADIPADKWARVGRPRVVIDCWRAVEFLQGLPGVCYIALGKGEFESAHLQKSATQQV